MAELVDALIIGSGPAGCTAALYASRSNLSTLVIAGYEPGGQLMLTSEVENYPGYPDGVQGPEMMADLRKQAERFGARFIDEDAIAADLTSRPFTVKTDTQAFRGRTLIIATGSTAKWLGLESEKRLQGKGVSACATCDGFFFKDKHVVVIGGGDSAMEEATFLTKYVTKVTVIHRRDKLRASKIMADRAMEHPKIDFVWDSEVVEVLGKDKVEGVRVRNIEDSTESELACEGVFLAIGHIPNTQLFRDILTTDDVGYIVAESGHTTHTNVEGVFVAGDVMDHRYRQAITAAGSGCKAAIDAERWLEAHGEAEQSLPTAELEETA